MPERYIKNNLNLISKISIAKSYPSKTFSSFTHQQKYGVFFPLTSIFIYRQLFFHPKQSKKYTLTELKTNRKIYLSKTQSFK